MPDFGDRVSGRGHQQAERRDVRNLVPILGSTFGTLECLFPGHSAFVPKLTLLWNVEFQSRRKRGVRHKWGQKVVLFYSMLLSIRNAVVTTALLVSVTSLYQVLGNAQAKPQKPPAQQPTSKRVRVLNASGDMNGSVHQARVPINAGAVVVCLTARSPGPGGQTMCDVSMPGGNYGVRPGEEVGATGPGTLTLGCRGQAPVSCSARVTD